MKIGQRLERRRLKEADETRREREGGTKNPLRALWDSFHARGHGGAQVLEATAQVPPAPVGASKVARLSLAKDFELDPSLGLGCEVMVLAKLYPKDDEYFAHRAAIRREQQLGLPQTHRFSRIYEGLVARMTLAPELRLDDAAWKVRGPGPRGVCETPHGTVAAFGNRLAVLDPATQEVTRWIDDPRLRNVHNVEKSPFDPNVVLVASTGAETLLEYDLSKGQVVWEWSSWKHGFDRTATGVRVLDAAEPLPQGFTGRLIEEAEAAALAKSPPPAEKAQDLAVRVDFARALEDPMGLPKWMRTAQPNWVGYGESKDVLYASFFQQGTVVRLDRRMNTVETVLSGLKMPHGLLPAKDGYWVSDTGHGRVLKLDRAGAVREEYDFRDLPVPKEDPDDPKGFRDSGQEWIQFTHPIDGGRLLATVDSRRSMLYVWEPERRRYNAIALPFDGEFQAVLAAPPLAAK